MAERVSSWAAKTVLGGDVSGAEGSGVVNPASLAVEIVVSTLRRPFAAPGDRKFTGYEKCGLDRANRLVTRSLFQGEADERSVTEMIKRLRTFTTAAEQARQRGRS